MLTVTIPPLRLKLLAVLVRFPVIYSLSFSLGETEFSRILLAEFVSFLHRSCGSISDFLCGFLHAWVSLYGDLVGGCDFQFLFFNFWFWASCLCGIARDYLMIIFTCYKPRFSVRC